MHAIEPQIIAPGADTDEAIHEARERLETERALLRGQAQVLAAQAKAAKAWDAKPAVHNAFHAATKAIGLQRARVDAAQNTLNQLLAHQQSEEWARTRWQELYDKLLGQYGRLGPQYDLLARALASAEVRVERLERADRPIDASALRDAHKALLEGVAALQKFTETQKRAQLVVQEREFGARVIVHILEGIIGPQAPQLWDAAMQEVQKHRMTEDVDAKELGEAAATPG